MVFDIEISRGLSSDQILMWDDLKMCFVNIDLQEEKRKERKKKLKRILNVQ